MGKVPIHIILTAVLLGIVIPQSMAATSGPGGSVTVTPADNTSSTVSNTSSNATDNSGQAIVDSPIDTAAPAGAVTAKPKADLNAKSLVDTDKKGTAGSQPSQYRGKYFGGKFGINNSSVSGTISAPSASTLAYGLQGGYLQGGYNWDLSVFVVGVGAYVDWNTYAVHSNGIAYGSRAYGLDVKLGLPVGDWMPYVKLGYGHNAGKRNVNFRKVAQNKSNVAVGFEYNFTPRWSAIAEYKRHRFSNRDGSITINNKIFSFGVNYYFDIPLEEKKVELAPEPEIIIPAPILAPDALPDAPPPP